MAHLALFPTPLGTCGIAWRGDKVVATTLPDETEERTTRRLHARCGGRQREMSEAPEVIRAVISAITALLEGERTDLTSIACDFGNTDPFSMGVYAATRAVPAGATSTYGAIAAGLGDKSLSRRVGQALGRNPLPIIVPCHRIMGANGRLVGFSASGGVDLKLRMLDIERARIGEAPGLFDDLPLAARPPG